MIKRPNTNAQRLKRHKRLRAKVFGTTERPRLNVFRSEKNIYAQVIDDVASWWPSAARPRASTPSCSTVAVTCITAAWPSWPKAPVRAAWNSKRGG